MDIGLTLCAGSAGDCCIEEVCAAISVTSVVKVTVSDSALSSIALHIAVVDGIIKDWSLGDGEPESELKGRSSVYL